MYCLLILLLNYTICVETLFDRLFLYLVGTSAGNESNSQLGLDTINTGAPQENQFKQQEIVNPELYKSAPEEIWNGNGMFIFKFVIYCKVLL